VEVDPSAPSDEYSAPPRFCCVADPVVIDPLLLRGDVELQQKSAAEQLLAPRWPLARDWGSLARSGPYCCL
jgi:hypothetical protein